MRALLLCLYLWLRWIYNIFPPTLSHKQQDFRGKKLSNRKCVFWFSLPIFFRNITHSTQNMERWYHKCNVGLHVTTRYSCQLSRKLQFSGQIFEKKKNTVMNIRPVGAELLHADRQTIERTDRHNESIIGFNNCPTRCDLFSLLYFCRQLYMFRFQLNNESGW